MLYDTLKSDLTKSMLAKDTFKTGILRMLISEIRNKEIELRAKSEELNDEKTLEVLTKEKKKRLDSIEMYKSSNREDLAKIEIDELSFIETFLPRQLSIEEVTEIIKNEIKNLPETDRNFNTAVKIIMPLLKGKADGRVVTDILKSNLS